MLNGKCPICDGVIISRCSCLKHNSICENEHRFHFRIRYKTISNVEIEIHEGTSDHFTEGCSGCKIIEHKSSA